jgi:hypothetical protein
MERLYSILHEYLLSDLCCEKHSAQCLEERHIVNYIEVSIDKIFLEYS